MSRLHAGEPESGWQSIMTEPAPLTWLVIGGSGKDLGLKAALADGRKLRMELSDVTVATEGAVEMQLEPYDETCLGIQYAGSGLQILSMQVTCPDPDQQEEFTSAVRAFIAGGGELDYRVGVRIALAATGGLPVRDGDPQ